MQSLKDTTTIETHPYWETVKRIPKTFNELSQDLKSWVKLNQLNVYSEIIFSIEYFDGSKTDSFEVWECDQKEISVNCARGSYDEGLSCEAMQNINKYGSSYTDKYHTVRSEKGAIKAFKEEFKHLFKGNMITEVTVELVKNVNVKTKLARAKRYC